MTARRRDWLRTFADPAMLSDLRAAAADCMSQVCGHEPHECDCRANLMQPVEFCDWVELEVRNAEHDPVRFERGHRPRRRKRPDQLTLAIAG